MGGAIRRLGEQDPPPATLAREGAAALWRATLAEPTGDGETSRDVYAAYASFARRVAKQVDYGLIVIPSLVTRSAEIHGHQASWDGVQQLVETPRLTVEGSGGGDQPWIRTNGIHGALRAASLHVAVFTPEGELRFEGAGGLTLLQRVELAAGQGPEVLRVTAAPDPFADPKALREGVEAAFATPLPASHAH